MKSELRTGRHAVYLAIGFLIYFIVYFDVLIHGKGTLVRGFDGSVQSFAWLSKLARDWNALQPPLWDFASFSGTSFIGEFQTGVLYPGNIILGFFTSSITQHTVDIYIFLHYVLAFYFMALFLRAWGYGLPATLIGAYAFASYLDWVQPHRFVGMIYLPLVLLFYYKSAQQRSRAQATLWLYLCGIALGLMIIAGHIQPYLHSVIALCLFAVTAVWSPPFSVSKLFLTIRRLIFVGFISALISAPQWLLSLEHFSHSYRWAPNRTDGLERVSYKIFGFVDVLAPELISYLLHSWIPFALIISLIIVFTGKGPNRRFALFSVLLLLVATLLGLGDRGYLSRLTYYIPLLNSAREATRYIFLILFASSALLAIVVETVPRGLSQLWDSLLQKAGKSEQARVWIQAIVIFVLLPPLWFHSSVFLRVQANSEPLSPVQLYQKGEIVRFLQEETAKQGQSFRVFNFKQTLARNFGNAFSILSIRGHRATILKNYFDFFSGALGNPLDPKLDVLGVKYVISPEPIDGMSLVMREGPRYLYRNEGFVPIFHWYDPQTGQRTAAKAEQIDFSANSVSFSLVESKSGLLCFSQPFFPGWKASVDSETREIREIELFMGLELKPADKHVTFRYRPSLLWVSLTGPLLIASALVRFVLSQIGSPS